MGSSSETYQRFEPSPFHKTEARIFEAESETLKVFGNMKQSKNYYQGISIWSECFNRTAHLFSLNTYFLFDFIAYSSTGITGPDIGVVASPFCSFVNISARKTKANHGPTS